MIAASPALAQEPVPVRQEPLHKVAFENQYLRLLDVTISPGDTSLYHIHATPSVFVILSDTRISSQERGGEWVASTTAAGTAWYRGFSPDPQVHRVCNADSSEFHVNDIEILSSFHAANIPETKALPIPLLFENEKVYAYEARGPIFDQDIDLPHGPLMAILVGGDYAIFAMKDRNEFRRLQAGEFVYIEPNATFRFGQSGAGSQMIFYEIK